MDWISPIWVVWMGVTTAGYWAVPKWFRVEIVAASTILLLLVIEPMSVVWLTVFTFVTYVVTRGPRPSGRRTVWAVAPVAVVLITYKFLNATSPDNIVADTVIPLGLSYYALRCMHYALERYKGNIRDLGPKEVIGYLFFIPTIFIGPIHRFPEWRRDRQATFDLARFLEGLERIVYGFVKVGFIGNFLISDLFNGWAADVTDKDTAAAVYLEMIEIGLNLYFQFSGFSDVAIGFSMLLGFRVMENFRWPFLQRNISEFWNCWHISLTSWSREYVFNSTVALTRNRSLGVLASLIAIALWHELSLRYLVWGLYHGLGIIVWQRTRHWWKHLPGTAGPVAGVVGHGLSVLTTVHFVFVGFLLVRRDGWGEMVDTMTTLVTGW